MSVDPNGRDIKEREDGTFSIAAVILRHGNKRHRMKRIRL
jgi:hypothetical protein